MASAITLNNLEKKNTRTHACLVTGALFTSQRRWRGETGSTKARKIPDDDDDEIQQVPPAAYVGAGVHDEAVGQNLGEGLDGEDDEEDVLNLFLWTKEHAPWGFMKKDR